MIFKKTTLVLAVLLFNPVSAQQTYVDDIVSIVEDKSRKYGVDKDLIHAFISTESGFRIKAISTAGAQGLMQVMPATGERMGVPRNQIAIPERNIDAGTKYIAFLMDRFNGNLPLVAAGYNAGEGAVEKYGNRIPPYRETQNYVPQIISKYKALKQCGKACENTSVMLATLNNKPSLRSISNSLYPTVVTTAVQPTQSTSNKLSSWLGGNKVSQQAVNRTQDPRPVTTTVQVYRPSVVKVSASVPRVRQIENRGGFVQTLSNDGTYQNAQVIQ